MDARAVLDGCGKHGSGHSNPYRVAISTELSRDICYFVCFNNFPFSGHYSSIIFVLSLTAALVNKVKFVIRFATELNTKMITGPFCSL